MNRDRYILLAFCGSIAAGCGAYVRHSSRDHLTDRDSQLLLPLSISESKKSVSELFAKRGFHLVDEHPHGQAGEVRVYKGNRTSVTQVSGYRWVYGTSWDVGSVFYALFQPKDKQTLVALFGKPTMDGRPVCSDYDIAISADCQEAWTGLLWPGLSRMSGREEAETIHGIELELKGTLPESEQSSNTPVLVSTRSSPKEPADSCYRDLQNTPRWKETDGVGRKLLLDACERSRP